MINLTEFHNRWSLPLRYMLAVAIFLTALALRFWLLPVNLGVAFITFYPATIICFYLCGKWPGALMVALSSVAANYFFIPPYFQFEFDPGENIAEAFYIFSAYLISLVVQQLQDKAEKLDELSQDFITFLENTSDFIYFKDENSRFRFCSQTLAKITGHDSWRDMIGKHDLEVFPEDTAKIYYEEELPIFRDGIPLLNQLDPYYDASGNKGWVSTSKWPLIDPEGKVRGLFGISRDVTELKIFEDKLIESEQRYLGLLEGQTEIICRFKADGTVLYVNNAFCRFFGKSREEVVGNPWQPVAYAEDVPLVNEKLDTLSPTNPVVTIENRVTGGDGAIHWVQFVNRAIYDEAGHLLEIQAIGRDITERKLAEERIHVLLREQKAMLETDLVGIVKVKNRVITWANPAYEKMLGYDRGELDGTPTRRNYVSEDEYNSFGAAAYPVLHSGNIYRTQFEHVRKDGGHIWVEISGAMLDAATGESLWTFIDITERLELEEKLAASAAEIEDLYDHAPCGYHSVGPDGTYLRINATELAWLGCTQEEVIGKKKPFDFFTPASQELFRQSFPNFVKSGNTENLEFDLVSKDGAIKHVSLSATAIRDDQGNFLRSRSVLHDITELKNFENTLRESEQRFRTMANAAPVLIWIAGKDKLCYWFNDFWLDFTGRTMEQEKGNGWAEGVHPEDFDRCLEFYVSHFDQRKEFRMEYRLRRHDGEYRWIDDHGVPRFSADGEFEGYIGSCIDIHDSKQINAERDRLLRIIEEAPDFIATSDMQAHLKFLNNAGARLVGLPVDVDLTPLEIKDMHPEWGTRLVLEEGVPTVLRQGFWQHENALLDRNDGREIPVSQLLLVHRDADGTPQLLSTIMRDITDSKRAEQALQQENEKNLALLRNASDGIHILDIEGNIIEASNSFCAMLGYRRDEVIGMHVSRWDAGFADDEVRMAAVRQQFENPLRSQFETRHRRKDGTIFDVEVSGIPLKLAGQSVLFNSSRDITERKHAEESLQLASLVYQNSSEAMMVTDANGIIITINPAFTRLTGYSEQEAIGQNTSILNTGHHDREFFQTMWRDLSATGHWQGEIWNKRKDGEVFVEWLSINAILNADGSVQRCVALFSDVTEKKKSEELIWKQANYDSLTGLPNRRMFHERLEQEFKKAHRVKLPLALLFLDLDHFKEVNDTLGHDMGDLLLKEATQRITSCVRETDTVARLGGDEFTLILGELEEPDSVERIANSIVEKLAKPFQLGTELAQISASIGIAIYPNDAMDVSSLLKNADLAMYAAKRQGRNQFHFYTSTMLETEIPPKTPAA